MYRGFNLKLEDAYELFELPRLYLKKDLESILAHRQVIIDSFTEKRDFLNGSQMQQDWFPQIKADVFISHSHEDLELAIALAVWLRKNFGLTAFIDSCVWGYSDDLLKMIDDIYCLRDDGSAYIYESRNYSTSHVHMMLSVALTQMIDNTECLFFLNTPNSLTINPNENKTESPWIYSEIAMSQLVRKKAPERYYKGSLMESLRAHSAGRGPNFIYNVPTGHLIDIGVNDLKKWKENWEDNDEHPQNSKKLKVHALDKLYEITKKDGR